MKKLPKWKKNTLWIWLLKVLGRVCQLLHYFASKQWLRIKSKQCTYGELFDTGISWSMWILTLLAFRATTKYTKNLKKYHTHWITGREVGLIKLLYFFLLYLFSNFTTFLFLLILCCYCPCLGFLPSQKCCANFCYKPSELYIYIYHFFKTFLSLSVALSYCLERIWNNYIEIQWKTCRLDLLCFYAFKGYNSLGNLTK